MNKERKPIIEIKNLTKEFDGQLVLKGFDLNVYENQFVTFLGPSGCGKTTTLRMIAGFEMPTSGSILLNGEDIAQLPPYKRPVNTVFQRYALFPHLDVYDNIAFGLKLKRVEKTIRNKKGNLVTKLVKLTQKEIDEKVDLKMRKEMQLELKEMHKKLGITFIYVTHDQEEALTMSDVIVIMKDGQIQQIGTTIFMI